LYGALFGRFAPSAILHPGMGRELTDCMAQAHGMIVGLSGPVNTLQGWFRMFREPGKSAAQAI
jgi:hypothetical protein